MSVKKPARPWQNSVLEIKDVCFAAHISIGPVYSYHRAIANGRIKEPSKAIWDKKYANINKVIVIPRNPDGIIGNCTTSWCPSFLYCVTLATTYWQAKYAQTGVMTIWLDFFYFETTHLIMIEGGVHCGTLGSSHGWPRIVFTSSCHLRTSSITPLRPDITCRTISKRRIYRWCMCGRCRRATFLDMLHAGSTLSFVYC